MTLEELADTLPDGFHDAQISSVSIDYIKREARLIIDLSVGDPSSEDEELRDAYREGELKLSGLFYYFLILFKWLDVREYYLDHLKRSRTQLMIALSHFKSLNAE